MSWDISMKEWAPTDKHSNNFFGPHAANNDERNNNGQKNPRPVQPTASVYS